MKSGGNVRQSGGVDAKRMMNDAAYFNSLDDKVIARALFTPALEKPVETGRSSYDVAGSRVPQSDSRMTAGKMRFADKASAAYEAGSSLSRTADAVKKLYDNPATRAKICHVMARFTQEAFQHTQSVRKS